MFNKKYNKVIELLDSKIEVTNQLFYKSLEEYGNVKGFTDQQIYDNTMKRNCKGWYNDMYLVKLEVFNTIGQKVAVLVNDIINAGNHGVNFNTDKLTAGVYYYTLTVNGESITKVANIIK